MIQTSDSNSTLVSLDNALKRVPSLDALSLESWEDSDCSHQQLRETRLLVACDEDVFEESESGSYQPLYLPADDAISADRCLACVPSILDTRDALTSQTPTAYTRRSGVLYVGQGEVAHTTCVKDVLVTDRATTCHMIALRSVSATGQVLASLAHLDGTQYTSCVRRMIDKHAAFASTVTIDIVGGYEDETSRDITHWLLHTLADLAEDYSDKLQFNLRTTCVTSLNNSTSAYGPAVRGLGLNVATGDCHSATCTMDCAPLVTLRSTRLWSRPDTLAVVYDYNHETSTAKELRIEPFVYKTFSGLDALLRMPDKPLLHYTSTSPECEEDDFCDTLRATLRFMRDVPATTAFGHSQPVLLHRRGHRWRRV